ncbi:MAG TPA: DUF192 domain-containing protein [Candidatus Baltobacteraceae bacterium]|nr:DUF192 domain-containing protein [Candidatus Baltobacteraceae bacterium]
MFNVLIAAALSVVVVHAPKADLQLEVAKTAKQREYGLMNRTSLPPHTGMIFVFPIDGDVAFWMKNTLVPLDMVFVGTDGTVRLVDANVAVVPSSTPDGKIPLENGTGKYVIELPAGEAAQDGIVTGTRLNLAEVPPAAPN